MLKMNEGLFFDSPLKINCKVMAKNKMEKNHYLFSSYSISSLVGITLSAPFLVVIMDAAVEANFCISIKSLSQRLSSPCSKTKLSMQPIKVSPAPVVSMVSGLRSDPHSIIKSSYITVLPSFQQVTHMSFG